MAKKILAVMGFGLVSYVQAATPNKNYDTIMDRNIFRLTDPPPPPALMTNNDALDRTLELSGITTISGQKKAWFIVRTKNLGKDAPLYVSLGENERQDFLEVSSISEDKGEVKIVNSGSAMTLSMEKNSPKLIPGAPVGAIPVPPPQVSQLSQHAVNQPQTLNLNNSVSAPNRSGVTVTGGVGNNLTPGNPTVNTGANGLVSIPSRPVRLQSQAVEDVPANPADQRKRMEIQQAVYQAAGQELPPIPPAVGNSGKNQSGPPALPTGSTRRR